MKEYQITERGRYTIPREVYHECIWIVRDRKRMENVIRDSFDLYPKHEEFDEQSDGVVRTAEKRLDCIHRALLEIPEEYREGVIRSVENRGGRFDEMDMAHENTWKKHRRTFIYALARNMNLYY